MSRRLVVVAVAVVVVVACVAGFAVNQLRDGRGSLDASGRYVPGDTADPSDLIGAWWPRGRASLDGRLLAIGPGEFAVFDDFCKAEGTWRASESGLLATFYGTGGSGKCDDLIEVSGTWFADIAWFASDDGQVELLNGSGKTVLTLEPAPERASDGLGDPGKGYPSGEPIAALPAGVDVPTTDQLVEATWLPVDGRPSGNRDAADEAFVEFAVDNYWRGSDGCNDQGGSWALHPKTGEWLATGGSATDRGCGKVPVAKAVTSSAAAGMDGDELVLYGADGDELGRFTAS